MRQYRVIQALSILYSKLIIRDRYIDPMEEVLITSGAYGPLYFAVQGHVDIGDEVIIIEPFYDCYEPMVRMAGGIPRFATLRLVSVQCNEFFRMIKQTNIF